tara:strand:+ start:257 stop:862 length:606 start_codon:yes stop_codon:yes gene_type:complete
LIGIINYGLGNVQSFINSFKVLGISAISISNKDQLKRIDRLILPGVGSFDSAIRKFNNSGLRDDIEDLVFNNNLPIMGVCIGMQIMANSSSEGDLSGLGWINGEVEIIDQKNSLILPHMGWNEIKFEKENAKLFSNLPSKRFYFLHSYHFVTNQNSSKIAYVNYGEDILAAISKNNIYGCQFHPEKSHSAGLSVLKNFANL